MKAARRFMAVTVASLMVFSFMAGCTKSESKPTTQVQATTVEKLKPVTIEFWSFARWNGIKGTEPDGKTGDWEMDAAKRFMEKYPHVKIDTQIIDSKTGPQKLSVAVAGGSAPDVLEDANNRFYDYANMGYLLPLDEYVGKDDLSDYETTAWEMTGIGDGKHYYFPWGVTPQFMLVNKTLFKQAGADNLLPQNKEKTWTRKEFITALKAATSKLDGVYGTGIFGDTSTGDSFLLNFLWSGGVKTFDDKLTKFALNSPKGVEGMKFLKELIDQKLVNPGAAGVKITDVNTLFDQQKILTASSTPLQYSRTIKSMSDGKLPKFEIEAYHLPTGEGEKPATYLHSFGFAVFSNQDAYEQKWAVEFAKFLASKENAAAIKASNAFSPRKSQSGLYDDLKDNNINFAASIIKYGVDGGISIPGYSQVRSDWTPTLQKFMLGKISPEEALKEMELSTNNKVAETKKTLEEQKKQKK